MTITPPPPAYLGQSLHSHPGSYWCPRCWAWTLDCSHLVAPLGRPRVPIRDSVMVSAAYDRARRILELEMNNGDRFQHFDVPLDLARGLVKAESPGAFFEEKIERRFRFERVRKMPPKDSGPGPGIGLQFLCRSPEAQHE